MYITATQNKIEIRDDLNGRILSVNYFPEKIVSAQVLSQDQIVVQTEKSSIVLRRTSRNSNSFSVYQRRRI